MSDLSDLSDSSDPSDSHFLLRQFHLVRPWIAVPVALVLIALFDRQVRSLENRPDLVLRNEERAQVVLPYYLARLHRANPSVVFLGDSVMQGVTNTHSDETAPVLVRKALRAKGRTVECFNTATMGNNIGDQLAISRAAIRNGADALVLSIHYKLFSMHGIVGNPLRYRDLAFYLRGEPNFRALLRDYFHIRPDEWRDIELRGNLSNWWGLYRYRGLIIWLFTGSMDNPLIQAQDVFTRRLGIAVEGDLGRNILRNFDPDRRDRDDIWREVIDYQHDSERDVYSLVRLEGNPHLELLEMWAKMLKGSGVPALVYFTPLNRELIESKHYFDFARHALFRQTVEDIMRPAGVRVADLTDAVSPAKFTDADHITRTGHRILAEALGPYVEELLDAGAEK